MKKTVLILGALSDIGAAIARKYASEGYVLQLAARDFQRLETLSADLRIRQGADVWCGVFDALAMDRHEAFYRSLPCPPDVVVCVFGVLGEEQKGRADFSEARKILDTNFTGAVSILNLAAQDMEQRKTGTIIGIGSVAGDRGRQSNYLYGCAKAGLAAYLSGLRNRLCKSGVHVMTVKPGFVRTRMTEGLKLPPFITGEPDQIARDIYRAQQRKTDVLYTLWIWRWIMLLITHIPEKIFKKLSM